MPRIMSSTATAIAIETKHRVMVHINNTFLEAAGVDIGISHQYSYIFLMYTESSINTFYIPKSRVRAEVDVIGELEELFPMLPYEAWTYNGFSVELKNPEDIMLLRLSI